MEATHFGVIPGSSSYAEVDAAARRAVAALAGEQPVGVVKFKELRLGGKRVLLVAADDPGPLRHPRDRGRLPRRRARPRAAS